jgi:molecular chaperone HtpG
MFTPGHLDEEAMEWLTRQLCDGELLVPARFAPVELPLVIVPDREAELKRRLEEDQADARISVSALKLARAFTAKVDGSVLSRLYLNLDCPAVVSLLEAYEAASPGAEAAARLLWSLKVVMASNREDSRLDLNKALSRLCEAAQTVAGNSPIK